MHFELAAVMGEVSSVPTAKAFFIISFSSTVLFSAVCHTFGVISDDANRHVYAVSAKFLLVLYI